MAGIFFLAGVTLTQYKNTGGTILKEQGKGNREHGEHVFPLVIPEHVPGLGTLRGKPIAAQKGWVVPFWRSPSPRHWFVVFGLLCHHTASNSITTEMHTSSVQ